MKAAPRNDQVWDGSPCRATPLHSFAMDEESPIATVAFGFDCTQVQREFFIDNLLVRIHFIIAIIRWTGLAPWEFEFPFPGSLTSTFLWGCTRIEETV